MAFHPDKCNVLSITRNKTPIKYSCTLHGHQLEHADKAKYLGITMQSDFKWDSHINSITTKANKTLGFLRRNINISSTTVKEQAYKSLVRPSLKYACFVWDPYTKENIAQLEQVQRRAARYVTNRYHNTSSVSNMIEHLNWQSLADRGSAAHLVMLYKILHELVTIPKTDILLLPLRFSWNMYSLSYQIPLTRLQLRQQSFFPRTIRNWNSLPLNTVKSDSVESFKSAVSLINHQFIKNSCIQFYFKIKCKKARSAVPNVIGGIFSQLKVASYIVEVEVEETRRLISLCSRGKATSAVIGREFRPLHLVW